MANNLNIIEQPKHLDDKVYRLDAQVVLPYYDQDGITIYNADARTVMLALRQMDAVITDPPYGVGETIKSGITKDMDKAGYDIYEDTAENYKKIVVPIIEHCLTISKRMILTPGNRNFCFLPQPDDFGCFYQPATSSMSRWGRPDAQPIFYYGKIPYPNQQHFNSYKLTERPSCDKHPCSKPMQAWMWIVAKGSLEGETILDPFMGSGTTLVAAKRLGRKAIGIEISQDYCDLAIQRLSQMEMF